MIKKIKRMADIILKDNGNLVYQVIRSLNHKNEMNVYKNVIALNSKGKDISVEDLKHDTETYWKRYGYKEDITLHDKLVSDFNEIYKGYVSLKTHVRDLR